MGENEDQVHEEPRLLQGVHSRQKTLKFKMEQREFALKQQKMMKIDKKTIKTRKKFRNNEKFMFFCSTFDKFPRSLVEKWAKLIANWSKKRINKPLIAGPISDLLRPFLTNQGKMSNFTGNQLEFYCFLWDFFGISIILAGFFLGFLKSDLHYSTINFKE